MFVRRAPKTRRMAKSLRRMGDEMYLRRQSLPTLLTIYLCQFLPGSWSKTVLGTWLSPTDKRVDGQTFAHGKKSGLCC